MPARYRESSDPMKKMIASAVIIVVAVAIIVPVTIKLARGGAYKQGERAFEAGKYEEAAAKFEQSVEASKKTTDSYLYLARIEGINGNYEAGVDLCDRVLEREPKRGMAFYWKALLLQLDGQSHRAMRTLEELSKARTGQAAPYVASLGGFIDLGELGPLQVQRRIEILKGTEDPI